MQVTQVNNAATTALGQTPAEDTASRADEFARVLRSAFSGKGSEAATKAAERTAPEAAARTETRRETRTPERPVADRPQYEAAETQRSDDDAAPRSESAPRETSPRETTAAKPAEKPAKSEAKPAKDAAQPTESTKDTADQTDKTAEAAPQTEAKDTAPAGEQAEVPVDETASSDETLLDTAEPVVAVDADAALILLNLLTQAQPVVTQAVAPATETAVATPVVPAATMPAINPLDAAAAALVAAADALQGDVPEQTAAAAAAAAAAATMQIADDAAATVTADAAAAAMTKTATATSAAALLSQQQTVTPEDFAAIQQALATQAQAQQGGKPVLTTEAAPKTEAKSADKPALTIDMQAATTTTAVKPLVDQAALFAMQGDDQSADDAALLQQQAQAVQTPAQPAIPELKFNAALLQANAEAQLQSSTSITGNNSSSSNQQAMSVSASSAPATQATQHTAAQTAARHLNPYIPAGEQVAVQIKKGVAEGADKISIKLDPGNLGKVEIKLEIGHDGRLMAVISADKPDTLLMLQRDASQLEQSLRDSGLKTDQQSLSFTLRDQGQDNNGRDGNGGGNGRNRGRGGDEYAETGLRTDPAQVAATNAQRAAAARGGLDIRI